MTLALDPLPCHPSPLRSLDSRWKLAALILATVAIAFLRTWPVTLTALAAAVGLALAGRLPLRWYLSRLGTVALVLGLFAAPLPFLLREPNPALSWGPVQVSSRGLLVGVVLLARGLSMVTLMLVLLGTAPLDATLKAAHSLRVPGLLVQLTLFTYRYLALVAEELARVRVALRVRGYRNRPTRHSYRTIGHVAGTLLVRSYERGERVGQAMRCRGFDGRFRSLTEPRTTAADVLFIFLITGSAAGLLTWDLTLR
jgi:cobalt/nickel transport system permease protein